MYFFYLSVSSSLDYKLERSVTITHEIHHNVSYNLGLSILRSCELFVINTKLIVELVSLFSLVLMFSCCCSLLWFVL